MKKAILIRAGIVGFFICLPFAVLGIAHLFFGAQLTLQPIKQQSIAHTATAHHLGADSVPTADSAKPSPDLSVRRERTRYRLSFSNLSDRPMKMKY